MLRQSLLSDQGRQYPIPGQEIVLRQSRLPGVRSLKEQDEVTPLAELDHER